MQQRHERRLASYVQVQSDQELPNALAEQQQAQNERCYTSTEDNAIRKELDEKFGTT